MSFAEELAGSTAPFGFFDPLGFSTVSNLLQVTSHPNHNKSTISSPFFFFFHINRSVPVTKMSANFVRPKSNTAVLLCLLLLVSSLVRKLN